MEVNVSFLCAIFNIINFFLYMYIFLYTCSSFCILFSTLLFDTDGPTISHVTSISVINKTTHLNTSTMPL